MLDLLLLNPSDNTNKPVHISRTGKFLLGITGGVALALTVVCVPFVSPALRKICLPYVPATTAQVENVFKALAGRKGSLIDLGSGDGRITIEAAKRGFTSYGIELNPWLVLYSKLQAVRLGLTRNTRFFRSDLWMHDFSVYDNIVIFGVEQMMADLEAKFINECGSHVRIVACRFPLPNIEPVKTIGSGVDTVWLYTISKVNK